MAKMKPKDAAALAAVQAMIRLEVAKESKKLIDVLFKKHQNMSTLQYREFLSGLSRAASVEIQSLMEKIQHAQ